VTRLPTDHSSYIVVGSGEIDLYSVLVDRPSHDLVAACECSIDLQRLDSLNHRTVDRTGEEGAVRVP